MKRRVLGIVMATSHTARTPDKNIVDVCGRPMFSYPIESLKMSGVCDKVIVSTDSELYKDIALECGVDDVVMREWGWDNYPMYSVSADNARQKYEEDTGQEFDSVAVVGGNSIFLRPSWIRTANNILFNYLNHGMPIEVVALEPHQWSLAVSRTRRGIIRTDEFYVLTHLGLLMEMDWGHEIELARELIAAINSSIINYPLIETVHDDMLANMESSTNRMGGLTPIGKGEHNG